MNKRKRRFSVQKTVPEGIHSILDRILERKDAKTAFAKMRLLTEYKKRIGEDFARHLKPEKVYGGTLYCLVDSPSWIQQYQFYTHEILRRINTPPLEEPITALRFTVGRIEDSEYLYDAAEQERTDSLTPPPSIQALEKAVASVNPELQDTLRSLVENWFAFVQAEEQEKK
jgi:hypothetical protein